MTAAYEYAPRLPIFTTWPTSRPDSAGSLSSSRGSKRIDSSCPAAAFHTPIGMVTIAARARMRSSCCEARATGDDDVTVGPAHRRCDRAEPELSSIGIASRPKPIHDGVVSAGRSELPVAAGILRLLIGCLQRQRADAIGVRGVITLHEPEGHLACAGREAVHSHRR